MRKLQTTADTTGSAIARWATKSIRHGRYHWLLVAERDHGVCHLHLDLCEVDAVDKQKRQRSGFEVIGVDAVVCVYSSLAEPRSYGRKKQASTNTC